MGKTKAEFKGERKDEEMKKLIAYELASDPRVLEGKRLILEALSCHQKKIQGIRPPQKGLKSSYEQSIKKLSEMRGGKLYFPYLGSGIGRGPFVELADGSVKYDFITGIGVHFLGHSHHEITESLLDAAISDTVMQGNLQQNKETLPLIETLLQGANRKGARLKHCFLSTSGAMANENALKILFQKQSPAHRILAFERCFMGRTLTMAQLTDKPLYRKGLPSTVAVDYVPFFDALHPEESRKRAVTALKSHLARYPGQHSCMSFELVLGEGGFYPGSRDFFMCLMETLKEHSLPIMVDEIQTFGRTTELFAFQHFGLDEYVDVVTIGKLSQICATLFKDEYTPQPGLVSQTFTGSTSAIFSSLVIMGNLINGDFFGMKGRNTRFHGHFVKRLQKIAQDHPGLVSGPFGIGGMLAFTPFDGDANKTKQFVEALFEDGVISFIAGTNPCRVRFLMPMGVITLEDMDEVASVVEKTLVRLANNP